MSKAFRGPDFGYVLVTTPAPLAIREVLFFAERLVSQGMRRDAFVVNRVHRKPRFAPTSAEISASLARHHVDLGESGAARLSRAVTDELEMAEADAERLGELAAALRGSAPGQPTPVRIDIPALPSDVHDLGTLGGVASLLCPSG